MSERMALYGDAKHPLEDVCFDSVLCVCKGDREARLLSGLLIRELQKQAAEAFAGQASQVCPLYGTPPPPCPTSKRALSFFNKQLIGFVSPFIHGDNTP